MENFNLKHLSLLIYITCLCLSIVNCNKISQGEQRRKFEFLYGLSNHAALTKELSASLYYYKDIAVYEEKFINIRNDIEKIKTMPNWDVSLILKNEFLEILNDDIKDFADLKSKNLKPDFVIHGEFEVTLINERISIFIDNLNRIISDVGKE